MGSLKWVAYLFRSEKTGVADIFFFVLHNK